jgi:PleD family two-component response regulator
MYQTAPNSLLLVIERNWVEHIPMNDERWAFPSHVRPVEAARVEPEPREQERLEPDWLLEMTRTSQPCAHVAVLIVDDAGAEAEPLRLILAMAGASTVHTITDPRTAVDRCREVRPDLVVIDLDTPELDGAATLAALRRTLADGGFLPMIALTAATSAEARRRALDAGASDHVTAPFDHLELVRRVRNLLAMRALYQKVRHHNLEERSGLESLS